MAFWKIEKSWNVSFDASLAPVILKIEYFKSAI